MVEFISAGDTWQQAYGGDTYNTAIYLARAGLAVDYQTQLGDDEFSDKIMALLAKEGVGTDCVIRKQGRQPGLYTIHNDDSGEREFTYWRNNSPARELFDTPIYPRNRYNVFYFTGITLAIIRSGFPNFVEFLKTLREQNCTIIFDPNYRPKLWESTVSAQNYYRAVLPYCHTVLPTLDDETLLWGVTTVEQCKALYDEFGIEELVIKAPSLSCHVYTEEGHIQKQASEVKPVDTTGAGDSFNAGYIAARCSGEGIATAISNAQALAAQVVQHRGAILAN